MKNTELTHEALCSAVNTLRGSERGTQALRDILAFIENGGCSLDRLNQQAVLLLLRCQFGPFCGSTAHEIEATGIHANPAAKITRELVRELKIAERFMSGFEDDEGQPGINARLKAIRNAIAKAEGRAQ